jgi:ubiquinone/menaquinone biosynthesis C-methylase UbiE
MSASLLSLWLLLSSAQAALEPSVRPGANQQYLDKDLSVWQQRFETAGREIFDHREEILVAARLKPGTRVADVGAGTGLFSFAFAGAVGPAGRVYAVDIIPKFIDHLRAESRKRRIGNVTAVLGKPRSVSLPPASVDVIFLCDAYHHFEYPRSMNRSMYRALRPGGTLVLIDFVRVPGTTPKWVLEHVRAGQQEFSAELVAAGFVPVDEPPPLPSLKENYLVRFTKPMK